MKTNHKLFLIYDNLILNKQDIALLKNFQNKNPTQVKLISVNQLIYELSPIKRHQISQLRKNPSSEELICLEKALVQTNVVGKLGIFVNAMASFPLIQNGEILDTDFILPINPNYSFITCANNVVGFANLDHPLIKKVQNQILAGYELGFTP